MEIKLSTGGGSPQSLKPDSGFNGSRMVIKVVVIVVLILLFLIPKVMITNLVRERQFTAEAATAEVADKWSLPQTLRGPALMVPYIERTTDDNNKTVQKIRSFHVLPESLVIDGEVLPQMLYRSIYHVVVYNAGLLISGDFERPEFEALNINREDIMWDKAVLSFGITDLRGISDEVTLTWAGRAYRFSPGLENAALGKSGISVALPLTDSDDFPASFSFSLNLKGSNSLNFSPLGKTTTVAIRSPWNSPGFHGRFIPANRQVTDSGFEADWRVLHYNRNFPQQWLDGGNYPYNIAEADFGVELISVAGHYQKSMRSAKYSAMVIILIFLSFFLNEMITGCRTHPFQYVLVGFAILLFYLLLLSFAEHIGFNKAYLVASLMTVLLIFAYSRTFLKTWVNSALLALILVMSLGFMFVLMQLESYALLAGSIGLFAVLALTMFFTSKIKWYGE